MEHVGYPPKSIIDSWPEPNLVNPPSIGYLVAPIELAFALVAFAMSFMRMYYRIKSKAFSVDDWLLALVIPAGVLMLISTIEGVRFGVGMHVWDLKPEWTVPRQKHFLIFETSSIFAHGFCRLSLLYLYKRIFGNFCEIMKWITIGIWYNIIVVTCGFTAYMLQCYPLKAYWLWDYQPRHCTNAMAIVVSINVFNCIGYFYVFFLPIPPVLKLMTNTRKKVELVALFAVGFITCAVSAIKVAVSIVLFKRNDPSWIAAYLFILCNVEKSLTLMCASVPAIRKLAVTTDSLTEWKRRVTNIIRSPKQTQYCSDSEGEEGQAKAEGRVKVQEV